MAINETLPEIAPQPVPPAVTAEIPPVQQSEFPASVQTEKELTAQVDGPFSGPAPTIDQTIQLAQTAAKEAFAANPEKEPNMLQQVWKHIRHQNSSPKSINQPISTTEPTAKTPTRT
jgi:hypothetical protein